MKYLKLFENMTEYSVVRMRNICADLYNEIGPYFDGFNFSLPYNRDIHPFTIKKNAVETIKKYKQTLDDYLTDLEDEFEYEFSLGDAVLLDYSHRYRIRYQFKVPKIKYDVFRDVFDQTIFDRIKDEYNAQPIYFRFYVQVGPSRSSPSNDIPYTNVDQFKEKVHSYVNQNSLIYRHIGIQITFS